MSDIFIGMLFMDVHGDVSENLENLNLSWKSVFLNVFDRIVGELPKNMTHTHTHVQMHRYCTSQGNPHLSVFQSVVLWS